MELVDIFEKKTQNQLYILKNVFLNHGEVNFKQLSTTTFLDFKTVKNLWEDISTYIDDEITLNSKQNYLLVRAKIIKESWVYQLCEKLLLKKELPLQSFINTHYISESKFRRKKKDLNNMISYLQIKIISKGGFIYIRGKELQIRKLAQQFFWGIYRGTEWPFKEIDYKKIDTFFKNYLFINHHILIKEVTYVEWYYNFSINLIRFNNGGFIKYNELPSYTDVYFSEISNLEPLKILLEKKFYLPLEEQYYFLYSLQMRLQYYLDKDLVNQTINAQKKCSIDTLYIYEELIAELKINKPNFKESTIARAVILSANMSATIHQGFYRDISSYLVGEFFEEKVPNLLPNIEKKVLQLKKNNPHISFLNEVKYLTIKYSEAYSLIENMFDFEPEVKVLITTDASIVLEELMVRKLNSIFSMGANATFMTTNSDLATSCDLLIKTTSLMKDIPNNKEILIVEPNLTEKDISEIKVKIEEITKIKKLETNYELETGL